MADFKELMTKQAGPLPGWAWVVLVGGGLGVTYYLNRRKSSGSSNPGSGVTTADATGSGSYVPAGDSAGNGGSNSSGSGTGTSFADNNAWGTAAINYLIGLGNDPGIVNQAIGQYLASQPLTTQQQAMVNSALQHFGSPPLIPAPVNGDVPGTGTGTNTGAMKAPAGLHVNTTPSGVDSIVWDADGAATSYRVDAKADTGKLFTMIIPAPPGNITTGAPFTPTAGHAYTITVTPQQGTKSGPQASINFKAA